MARVSGSFRVITVPCPALLLISMLPRRLSMPRLTTSMPTPAAGDTGYVFVGGKAGGKDQVEQLPVAHAGFGRDQALGNGGFTDGHGVKARAIVADANQHIGARMFGRQVHRALARFAGRRAHLRGFHAVIDAVADDMHQRVIELLDDGFIQFGLSAFGDHCTTSLPSSLGQVAHQAASTCRRWRRWAVMRMDMVLSRSSAVSRSTISEMLISSGSPSVRRLLAEPRLHGDQLAHQIDEGVQLVPRLRECWMTL